MKYNQKGFTLIELLAVIAILAIIALITTPAILNVIEDARLKGSEDKAWGVIDAVKQTYAQAGLKTGFSNTQTTVYFASATGSQLIGGDIVQMSGERPTSGSVSINTTTGAVTASNLRFTKNGTYTCSTNNMGTKMCCARGTNSVSCTGS